MGTLCKLIIVALSWYICLLHTNVLKLWILILKSGYWYWKVAEVEITVERGCTKSSQRSQRTLGRDVQHRTCPVQAVGSCDREAEKVTGGHLNTDIWPVILLSAHNQEIVTSTHFKIDIGPVILTWLRLARVDKVNKVDNISLSTGHPRPIFYVSNRDFECNFFRGLRREGGGRVSKKSRGGTISGLKSKKAK